MYSGGVPVNVDLKGAKEVTVTLKVRVIGFDEVAATVPLKMR